MGKRSSTETLVAVFQAFLRQRTWTQAALAREVGIDPRALRPRLLELQRAGVPLHQDDEHPHVYWSVGRDWFPGGVLIAAPEAAELLRQLVRAPRSRARDQLIDRLLKALPLVSSRLDPTAGVISPVASEGEALWLSLAEDSASRGAAMRMQYYTASRGELEWRHVSVQTVDVSQPARLVGACHRTGELKWFRIDNVLQAHLDPGEPYRKSAPYEVKRFVRESLDGYHGGTPVLCSFFVADPEARWVRRNLLEGTSVATVDGGIRVEATTTAVIRLARFVVGLGAAARVETPELQGVVMELARGAIERAGVTLGHHPEGGSPPASRRRRKAS